MYNGMYVQHNNAGHHVWRKEIDDKREAIHCARKGAGAGAKTTGTPTPAGAVTPTKMHSNKKLALSESLYTTLCTQAGLSAYVTDRIWTKARRDSVNDWVKTAGGASHGALLLSFSL